MCSYVERISAYTVDDFFTWRKKGYPKAYAVPSVIFQQLIPNTAAYEDLKYM